MLPLSFKEFLDFTQKNESETLEDKLNEYGIKVKYLIDFLMDESM